MDLKDAFQQIEVAENSQEYLTINTHMGLFRYRRLIFGISCAPTYFQSTMDQILNGLDHTVCFIDDLLVGGNTLAQCSGNVTKVIVRLSKYNVRVKIEKCKFFMESVEYLGHEISIDGTRPNKKKVQVIVDAPKRVNLSQLKSYLGLINYYGKFLPNLSKELNCLYKLTKQDSEFVWSLECDKAFERSTFLLLSNQLLVHYDPNRPLAIHCDATPYGLGAILSHIIDGRDRPIMFVSCTLTYAQKNYAQLHREALAIVFGQSSWACTNTKWFSGKEVKWEMRTPYPDFH